MEPRSSAIFNNTDFLDFLKILLISSTSSSQTSLTSIFTSEKIIPGVTLNWPWMVVHFKIAVSWLTTSYIDRTANANALIKMSLPRGVASSNSTQDSIQFNFVSNPIRLQFNSSFAALKYWHESLLPAFDRYASTRSAKNIVSCVLYVLQYSHPFHARQQ